MTVRTRFAPSPTGYLHIGGVRTALFNWLFAKQAGGKFVLRIDDTDADRNVDAALQPILEGFRWLGLHWDEGPEVGGSHEPYFQSQRRDRHRDAVSSLVESGHAYRDYSTPEELAQWRSEAEAKKEPFVYDRRRMAADDSAAAKYEAEGRQATIRLKMPRDGNCVIEDLVRGKVEVPWSNEQDHVIARADGSPLYHLASSVDDHELQISHVIRAEEHLSNTPRQIFILQSLGYALPKFAHLPYVAEPGGSAKLSKRKLAKYEKNPGFRSLYEHGQKIASKKGIEVSGDTFNPVIVDFYREIGFDAEAILNYLVLLGWSLDGEREKFTVDEMVENFSLDRVNPAPASFDPAKLLAFQGDHFANLPLDRRQKAVWPFAEAAGWTDRPRVDAVVDAAGDRLKMAGNIYGFGYCFEDVYEVDQKAWTKRIENDEHAKTRLNDLADRFESVQPQTAEAFQTQVNEYCEASELKLKDVIHALRVATTGQASGFSMFETLAILGFEPVVRRLRTATSPT